MRYFILGYILLIALVVSVAGFRGSKTARSPIQIFNDMDVQAKSNAQSTSDFFGNGQAAQLPVAGTIPMGWEVPVVAASAGGKANLDGYAFANDYLNTGRIGEFYGHGMPEEITVDVGLLEQGQEKFSIYCAICHGESGNGAGVISKYGIIPTNLITAPVADPAQRPDGNLYDVLVNGKGLMGGYGANLTLKDRWSIVAYVRTLQQRKSMPAAEVQKAFDEAQGEAKPAAE